MTDQQRVATALRERARDVDASSPLGLADVQSRARSIRRRRVAASGLAAVAVLAVAVPAGIAVSDRTGSTPETGPAATDDASPQPSAPEATPQQPQRTALSTDVPDTGGEPDVPYVLEGKLDLLNGSTADVGDLLGRPQAAVVAGLDVVLMGYGVDSMLFARVGPSGAVEETWDSFGAGGEVPHWLADLRQSVGGQLAVVPAGFDPEGTVVAGDSDLGGVAMDGRYSQVVSRSDTGSCSAVFLASGGESWRTCHYTLTTFSPDGRYVVGRPAYLDGLGDASLAILDAGSGDVVAEFERTQTERDLFLSGPTAWDSSRSVLAQAWNDGRWHLLRLGVDGTISRVDAGDLSAFTDETDPPLTLAVVN